MFQVFSTSVKLHVSQMFNSVFTMKLALAQRRDQFS